MRPGHALLRLPAAGDASLLRRLARGHPKAAAARCASRSYRGSLALVAWHSDAVGVDLERIEPGDRAFAESICTPDELRRFGPRLDDAAFLSSLWSSKEALAKALGDPVAYDPRRLESPLGWPDGAAGAWRAHALTPAAGHVGWLVWRASEES